jgi:hypothetical protein
MADQLTLLGAALGAAVTITTSQGKFDWWDSILGWALLFILLAYGSPTNLSKWQQIARNGIAGLCTLIGLMVFVEMVFVKGSPWEVGEDGNWMILVVWLVLTGAYWLLPIVWRTYVLRKFAGTTLPSARTP